MYMAMATPSTNFKNLFAECSKMSGSGYYVDRAIRHSELRRTGGKEAVCIALLVSTSTDLPVLS